MIKYEFNQSMSEDKSSYQLAFDRLFQLKDSNIKRQADVHKLRIGLQNLKNDVQIYHVSNQLKIQNLLNKASSDTTNETESKETQDQSSIDSGQMVNNQISTSLEQLSKIELHLNKDISSMAYTSKNEANSLKNTTQLIKQRRRSVGNISIFQLMNTSTNNLNESRE